MMFITLYCSNFQKQQPRRFFKTIYICSFFPGATILKFARRVCLFVEQTCFFQDGLLCSSNRHKFSRRVYRTDIFSTRFYLSVNQTLLSHRSYINFPEPSIFLSNIYSLSRKLYMENL